MWRRKDRIDTKLLFINSTMLIYKTHPNTGHHDQVIELFRFIENHSTPERQIDLVNYNLNENQRIKLMPSQSHRIYDHKLLDQ